MRVAGHDLAGIHYLPDVDDALGLRHELDAAERVVVVGGGFVGLEAAAAARAAGKDVTVVEAADRLMARAVAPSVSDDYAEAHRRRGTTVRLGAITFCTTAQALTTRTHWPGSAPKPSGTPTPAHCTRPCRG
jgi:3-phenylpropionate/trans-cinnamate dioxygenase ferredoxin reductase subunit